MKRIFVCYGINALVIVAGAVLLVTQDRHGADAVIVGMVCAFVVIGVTQYGRSVGY